MKKLLLFIILVSVFICFNQSDLLSADAQKQRIVSLAPSTTEILFALGLDEEIVGVSSFCDYPLKALEKEKVGTFSQPNIEKILSLRPDIVFCTGLEQMPVIRKLKQLKLKVYVSDPKNVEETFESIMEMGVLTYREKEAEDLVSRMKRDMEGVTSKVKSFPKEDRVRVFVELWNNPLMTTGRGSFMDELIALAGGINIAHDTERPYSYFSPEQVLDRDPECIILAYMVNEEAARSVKERLGWKKISAVRNNRIYNDIDPDILLRPGPRLVEGLNELHKRLYP
ncbi:MAG: cobalamin-binding protein [Candidatus Omnitrophica bacterium]|nr:cobalamin-binding protein [Candidatus Omnitrophota bacterium]